METCPFCGSQNVTVGYNGQPAIQYYGLCLDCRAQGPIVDAPNTQVNGDEIVRLWNGRTK